MERVHGWRVPTQLHQVLEPVLYLEALMAPTVAASLGLVLLEPPEDWLPNLPAAYRQREVRLATLAEARHMATPLFVKPPNDKSFEARVYQPGELPDFPDDTAVLLAEVVRWEKEFRCFILNRQLQTFSVYLRNGLLQREDGFSHCDSEETELTAFVSRLLNDVQVPLPRAIVLDVGVIAGRGWAVVELNAAWGSGIYGCDPDKVLDVVRQAVERKT